MKVLTAGVSTQDLAFRRSGSLAGTPRVPFTLGGDVIGVVVNYLTAHMTMHRIANIRSGEHILVHGAAGDVRTALLELGQLARLQMHGTTSKYSHELVPALGATPVDYRIERFVA